MGLFCGDRCQDRKDVDAQAKLLAAQAQADALKAASAPSSSNTLIIVIVAALLLGVGAFIYFKFIKK